MKTTKFVAMGDPPPYGAASLSTDGLGNGG